MFGLIMGGYNYWRMNGFIDGWMNTFIDEWMALLMDGFVFDGLMDLLMYEWIYRCMGWLLDIRID